MGLSQETDAIIVVVSEETGAISVTLEGRIERGLDADHLRQRLRTLVLSRHPSKTRVASPRYD